MHQLIAYGIQDVYLTGAPKITFLKTTYRRHKNFSYDWDNVEPTEPTDGIRSKNNLFLKELIEMKLYKEYYTELKYKIKHKEFEIDTCDICMDSLQEIKTSCGHKYCNMCFIKIHIHDKKNECSFCKQNISNRIYLHKNNNSKKR